jgi:predicted RNA-binding protein associated with RNAse of E/G family
VIRIGGMKLLKRRFGDRSDWKRVLDKDYTQAFLDRDGFKGYATLLKINKVIEPLTVSYVGKNVCIVDDDYIWLQHFPEEEMYSLTTMFDSRGKIVQWYIDICHKNGVENNVPWMDDLFLDIVVLPSGEVIELDLDELEEALSNGVIDKFLYNRALEVADSLNKLIKHGDFSLLNLSEVHKDLLLNQLK